MKPCSDYFEAFSLRNIEAPDEIVPYQAVLLTIDGDIKEEIPSDTKLQITADNKEYVSLLYSSLSSQRKELYTKATDQTFDLRVFMPTEVKVEEKEKIPIRVEAYIIKDEKRVFCVEGVLDVQKSK
ncbi:hypothetical protein KVV02_000068 [Mortierella alpina]|uniref:Uncharacterized protein n=1 Tax=Mortierella alpina TaxID=64518 RepID=A0A9P8A4U8_MORAP|nr:hypothetical protein KVV02_000068 [Mortierella alpina]